MLTTIPFIKVLIAWRFRGIYIGVFCAMYAQAERIGPSNQKNMLISFSITFFVNVNTMLTKKKKKKKKLPLDAEPFHIPNLKATDGSLWWSS